MALQAPNPTMDGVDEDIEDFVYNFVSSECVDFERFVELWNQKHLCYIYSGRTRIPELKYYTREVLIIAKKYTDPQHSDSHRVAGIFMMYALFYIQPLKIQVHIRIEKDEFKELLEFIKRLNNKEVKYCFYKLLLDHAFDYVYSDKLYSLERIREREVDLRLSKSQMKRNKQSRNLQLNKLWSAIDFDRTKWLEAEKSYNELKSSISEFDKDTQFEMTDFIKPLLDIAAQPPVINAPTREAEPSQEAKPSTSEPRRRRPKRARAAFNVLFEDPSSSDEGPLELGTTSMPQLDLNEDSDNGDEKIDDSDESSE